MTELTNLVSKVTVKGLGVDGAKLIGEMKMGETRIVGAIYGNATAYKVSPSQFKDQNGVARDEYKFKGNFEGANLETGETINSTVAYMPNEVSSSTLAQAIDALGEEGGAVEFGVQIAIKKIKRRDGTDGYEFGVAVPKSPSAADPLAGVRSKMIPEGAKQQALPAPKAEAKK